MADAREFDKLKSALGPGADCPPLPELAWALETGEGDERRQSAERHLAGCAHCRDEVALWREFSGVEPRPDESREVRWIIRQLDRQQVAPRPGRRFAFLWEARAWAAVACALLVVVGVLYMRRGPGQPSAVGIEDGLMRSQAVELMAPVGEVRGTPAEFRWRAVPGAVRYEVRLMELDHSEVWRGNADASFMPVPAAAAGVMVPGKALMWQVRATDAAGKLLAESPARNFRITRDSR